MNYMLQKILVWILPLLPTAGESNQVHVAASEFWEPMNQNSGQSTYTLENTRSNLDADVARVGSQDTSRIESLRPAERFLMKALNHRKNGMFYEMIQFHFSKDAQESAVETLQMEAEK